jgi:pilus assembly protein CpaE
MLKISVVAYTKNKEIADILAESKNNITFARSNFGIRKADIDDAIDYYSQDNRETPDLLIIEVDGDNPQTIRDQIDNLADFVSSQTRVVIIGQINDVNFYRELKDIGIAEYLPIPFTSEIFVKSVKEIYGDTLLNDRGHIIAVFGAKGGVGSSTIAQNIAVKMADMYKKPITIVDMDVFFGNVGINFNEKMEFGLRDALDLKVSQGDIDTEKMLKILTKKDDNLSILASNSSLQPCKSLSVDTLSAVIDKVSMMSEYVILDFPHLWDENYYELLFNVNNIIIVTDPTLVSLRNAQSIKDAIMTKKSSNTKIDYVVNMIGIDKATELSLKEISDGMGKESIMNLGWFPSFFRMASLNGYVLLEKSNNKIIQNAFYNLCILFSNEKNKFNKIDKKTGFMEILKNIFFK